MIYTQQVTGNDTFVLIDKDTGTVLGHNVVAIPEAFFSEDEWDDISSSDDAAFRAAEEHGFTLYTRTTSQYT